MSPGQMALSRLAPSTRIGEPSPSLAEYFHPGLTCGRCRPVWLGMMLVWTVYAGGLAPYLPMSTPSQGVSYLPHTISC